MGRRRRSARGSLARRGSCGGCSSTRRGAQKSLRARHTNRGVNAAAAAATAAVAAPHAGVSVGLLWGGVRVDGRAYGGWAAVGRGGTSCGRENHRFEGTTPEHEQAGQGGVGGKHGTRTGRCGLRVGWCAARCGSRAGRETVVAHPSHHPSRGVLGGGWRTPVAAGGRRDGGDPCGGPGWTGGHASGCADVRNNATRGRKAPVWRRRRRVRKSREKGIARAVRGAGGGVWGETTHRCHEKPRSTAPWNMAPPQKAHCFRREVKTCVGR